MNISSLKNSKFLAYGLIFLVCIGFMTKANQLIFLALFAAVISKKGRIHIGKYTETGILILFCVTLLIFGMLGQVGTAKVGIVLPIAYCIGASMFNKDDFHVEKFILFLAISMDLHVLLNLAYEIIHFGLSFCFSAIHYDIWSGTYSSATGIMTNAAPLAGCFYYLLFKTKGNIKLISFLLLITNIAYDLILGGRTFFVLLLISFMVGFVADTALSKAVTSATRKAALVVITTLFISIVGISFYYNNSNVQTFVENTYFYKRFFQTGAYERLTHTPRGEIRKIYLANMTKYPWGGRMIGNTQTMYAHELYLDIFDIGGIFPLLLMMLYVGLSLLTLLQSLRIPILSVQTKVLLIGFYGCINAQFFVEPILTGAPTLLIVYCLANGYMAACVLQYRKGAIPVR